ncbi:SRPBCC family protein [Pseudonocardia sp. NPDC049635]|uniref:SRPBCC family protein n=1 Tax=Pseudonocardia sp. NPDC049635 TaxID=3155506 RepID=UPI0033D08D9C
MEFVVEQDVPTDAEHVWSVLADPVDWPRWTDSITRIDLLDGGIAPGDRVRIVQPRLVPMTWTVTRLVEGAELTWVARGLGVATTGTHLVTGRGPGRSRLRLGLAQHAPVGVVVGTVLGRLTRRYLGLEAAGIAAAALEHRGAT